MQRTGIGVWGCMQKRLMAIPICILALAQSSVKVLSCHIRRQLRVRLNKFLDLTFVYSMHPCW